MTNAWVQNISIVADFHDFSITVYGSIEAIVRNHVDNTRMFTNGSAAPGIPTKHHSVQDNLDTSYLAYAYIGFFP